MIPAPIILNSLPKSGTHLLTRVFEGLPDYSHTGVIITTQTAEGCEDPTSGLLVGVSTPRGMERSALLHLMEQVKPGAYHFGHIPYTPATQVVLEHYNIKMIALVRDPRAVVCSFVHFILKIKNHWLNPYFAALPTLEAQLALAIRGIKPDPEKGHAGLLPIGASFESVARWGRWQGARLVFFEDLIGPQGGGSNQAQREALDQILDHVQYPLDEHAKKMLGRSLFSKEDPFFRKGQIDGWKNDFTNTLESYFEEHAGTVLRSYQDIAKAQRIL